MNRRAIFAGLALGLWAVCAGVSVADVTTLTATKDNTLYEDLSGLFSNGAGDFFFAGNNDSATARRGVIAFDVSGIPAGSTINSVTLTLFMSRTSSGSQTITTHRLTADWGEGTSNAPGNEGAGNIASIGDATWLHTFYNTDLWASPGGDFVGTASASRSVGGNGTYTWSGAGMVADVQAWIDVTQPNYGWLLRGNEATDPTSKRFDSRTNPAVSQRPSLFIDYTPPSVVGACCYTNGSCIVTAESFCITDGGTYQGDSTSCSPNPCVAATGACCFNDTTCMVMGELDCESMNGTYQGDMSACIPDLCPFILEPFISPLPIMPVAVPTSGTQGGVATYDISMQQVQQQLHPDLPPTTLWAYDGIYPGPTIEATADQTVTVNWINDLRDEMGAYRTDHLLPVVECIHGAEDNAKTVVHLHGAHTYAKYDGFPEDTYLPGELDTYLYPNNQLPTLLWYHDHALGQTRLNVYLGLAGAYIIRDAYEQGLALPTGEYEVPLIIQDRSFNQDGSLQYPETWQPHFFGDTILVNGEVWPYMNVDRGRYRFRVLNGSNARTYTLALSNGATFHVIGSDGGLLFQPVAVTSLTLGPAERADIIIDFQTYAPGTEIVLTNSAPAPFPGTPGVGVVPNVMKFVVQSDFGFLTPIPTTLRPINRLLEGDALQTRSFELQQESNACTGVRWLINGLRWNDVTEFPNINTTEIWRFVNPSGLAHPMHMHLVMFQVLDRQQFEIIDDEVVPIGSPVNPPPEEDGWKDTVIVHPNEIVRVIARFEDYGGKFVYHCHILEHEDQEMMRQFVVVIYGDIDQDGDVDLSDFAQFSLCFGGPENPPAASCPPGVDADFDDDGDVDLTDFAVLSVNYTGPL